MQWQVSFSGLSIPSSFEGQIGFEVKTVTVYNNTPAQVALAGNIPGSGPGFPYGAILIPAFYPITVPVQGWRSIGYATDGTAMFAGSSLLIIANDNPAGGNPLSPFGPSGWGAGSGGNSLVTVTAGQAILAWHVQQIIDLLTGVMTGQRVDFENGLTVNGQSGFPATGLTVQEFAKFGHDISVSGHIECDQFLRLFEIAAPGTPTSFGNIYVALDGSLHYIGPSGTDTKVANA